MLNPLRILLLLLSLLSLPPLWGAPQKPPPDPVDLNRATATELMQLPRVGPRTAARILDYRKAHGPFLRVEDLLNVNGIGEKAFLRLKPHLATGEAP